MSYKKPTHSENRLTEVLNTKVPAKAAKRSVSAINVSSCLILQEIPEAFNQKNHYILIFKSLVSSIANSLSAFSSSKFGLLLFFHSPNKCT